MISVRGTYKSGKVKLEEHVDTDREIPVIVTFLEDTPSPEPPPRKYNFSDLAGKLKWKGDAVAEQRTLRDEWVNR